jgi:hypothetical protein
MYYFDCLARRNCTFFYVADIISLPNHWSATSQPYNTVALSVTDQEYKDVQQGFHATCLNHNILKVIKSLNKLFRSMSAITLIYSYILRLDSMVLYWVICTSNYSSKMSYVTGNRRCLKLSFPGGHICYFKQLLMAEPCIIPQQNVITNKCHQNILYLFSFVCVFFLMQTVLKFNLLLSVC